MDADAFQKFRAKLWKCFAVPDGEIWEGGPCIEVLFDIVEGNDALYEFDFANMRLTQDLLLGAILLS